MAKHGDAKILYLLGALANCPKAQSTNIYDGCKARYEGLSTQGSLQVAAMDDTIAPIAPPPELPRKTAEAAQQP
jgi:hypothetical protein